MREGQRQREGLGAANGENLTNSELDASRGRFASSLALMTAGVDGLDGLKKRVPDAREGQQQRSAVTAGRS